MRESGLLLLEMCGHGIGGGGENCTPDDLLCWQTPCCLGYTALGFGAQMDVASLTSLGKNFPQACVSKRDFKKIVCHSGNLTGNLASLSSVGEFTLCSVLLVPKRG